MEKYKRAILGFVIGDAFGVPVEFEQRDSFNIHEMVGYGTWNVPPGTWSDDSAMTFITMQHLIDHDSLDDLKKGFCDWAYRGYWTYNGQPSFDVGITIAEILNRWEKTGLHEQARSDEKANGNGALMRILPIALSTYKQEASDATIATYAALTHGHIRSTLCCIHYKNVIHQLLDGHTLQDAIHFAHEALRQQLNDYPIEQAHFNRLLQIEQLTRDEIKSSGYVMHTLEAVYWSLLHSDSYYDAIHKAVHLGGDTDTIGAITGSIAGILYDELNVPSDWFMMLPKYDDIYTLITKFTGKCINI